MGRGGWQCSCGSQLEVMGIGKDALGRAMLPTEVGVSTHTPSLGSLGTLPESGDREVPGAKPQHQAMLLLQPQCPGGARDPQPGGCGWEPPPHM